MTMIVSQSQRQFDSSMPRLLTESERRLMEHETRQMHAEARSVLEGRPRRFQPRRNLLMAAAE